MTVLPSWLRSLFSGAVPPTTRDRAIRRLESRLAASFDAAQNDPETRKHFAAADALAPDAAASPEVRATVRNRARYETANNSYAAGIVATLANDTIGEGPRLQLVTDQANAAATVESAFADWSRAVALADKLRTMRRAKAVDGEAFAILQTNPSIAHAVTLDLQPVEADQIATPFRGPDAEVDADGIEVDRAGNVTAYHVLRRHPGSLAAPWSLALEYDRVPASLVLHWFRADRPGQRRGVSELMPALKMFALLRRYALAELTSAEVAALMPLVLESDAPAGDEVEAEPFEEIELARGLVTTLPAGHRLNGPKAEHPATTYGDFKDHILAEIARCICVPFNVAAGNSSRYNYASGRLDFQIYFRSIVVEQAVAERVILAPVFDAWLREARLTPGKLGDAVRALPAETRALWFWPGFEHVDPSKEAAAQAQRLQNHTTTLADECAREGRDWETVLRQAAREEELRTDLGLATPRAARPNVDAALKILGAHQAAQISRDSATELLGAIGLRPDRARRLVESAPPRPKPEPPPAAVPPAEPPSRNGNGMPKRFGSRADAL